MKKQAGLWIDHRQTYVIILGDDKEETLRIESGMEKHGRFSGNATAQDGSADDQRDRQFMVHLDKYYDQVMAHLGDAASILILGPGEAKGEFKKRLEAKCQGKQIVDVEAADKMTEKQIAAKVRHHYKL